GGQDRPLDCLVLTGIRPSRKHAADTLCRPACFRLFLSGTDQSVSRKGENDRHMITDGFLYLGVLLALAAAIVFVANRSRSRFFKYVPGFVLLYIFAAALNTAGVFGETDEIETTGDTVQDAVLPTMIHIGRASCRERETSSWH